MHHARFSRLAPSCKGEHDACTAEQYMMDAAMSGPQALLCSSMHYFVQACCCGSHMAPFAKSVSAGVWLVQWPSDPAESSGLGATHPK